MRTNEELINRRQALLAAKSKLNRSSSLKTKEGRAYLSCLVMLAATQMQITEQEKAAHIGATK